MYYINKQGGTHSLSLLYLAVHHWEWCYDRHIFPVAIHVATEDNSLVGSLSRWDHLNHEWSLHPAVFRTLCQKWGNPTIDVFASPHKTKCQMFCMRAGKGQDSLGDAFTIKWMEEFLYLFLPVPLLFKLWSSFDRTNLEPS